MKKTFILDWDGTATDNYARADDTLEIMIRKFSTRYKLNEDELLNQHKDLRNQILGNERDYKWIHKGQIVAYCEDPIILNNMAFVEILKDCKPEEDISKLWSETLTIFSESYRQTSACYVPLLLEVLDYLKSHGNVIIVTNSNPQKVSSEINEVYSNSGIKVIGYAKKYKIEPKLEEVPEKMLTKDARVVNLRRGNYYSILRSVNFSLSYVIGDGFSCDLALPLVLGFNVVLISDFQTMGWAKKEVGSYKRGSYFAKISELLEIDL